MKFLVILMAVAALAISAAPAHAQGTAIAQTFQTSGGVVKITPVFHATVLLEAGGKVIYVDPAKPANVSTLPKADLILITHEHGDHVDMDQTTVKAVSKAGTEIWTPASVAKFVTTASVMNNGQTKKFGDWTIEAVPAYNMERGPSKGQYYHPKGRDNGYVLTYGGKRFYFSGDTEATPEMKALRNIDVAFICMNLPYTMTPAEAAEAVKVFKPKVVIPYHFRSNPPGDLNAFQSALQGTGVEVRLLNWYPTASGN